MQSGLEKLIKQSNYFQGDASHQFADLIGPQLDKKPLRTLLLGWNHPEGIGDLKTLIDFINYYEEALKQDPRVNLQSFCFISPEKLQAAKLQLKGKIPEDQIYFYNADKDDFDPAVAEKCKHTFWISSYHFNQKGSSVCGVDNKSTQNLNAFMRSFNHILLVARPPGDLEINQLLVWGGNAYRQSICEYGIWPTNSIEEEEKPQLSRVLLDSSAMGVNPKVGEVGIKFYSDFNQPRTLRELSDEHVFAREMKRDIPGYLAEHFIVFGYLQIQPFYKNNSLIIDTCCIRNLIITASAITEKKYIDIYGDNKFADEVAKYFIDPKNREVILALDIGSLVVVGEEKESKRFDLKTPSQRQVRLIQCTGISESDKNTMIAIADLVAGSGNSSHSEVISACLASKNKFFYLQARPWILGFFAGILACLNQMDLQIALEAFERGEEAPDFEALKDYIRYVVDLDKNVFAENYSFRGPPYFGIGTTIENYIQFLKANHTRIAEQFKTFCEYLFKNYDVVQEQNNIFARAATAVFLSSASKEEIMKLLKICPDWKLGKLEFVAHAVLTNNLRLLASLQTQNPKKFAEKINEKIILKREHQNKMITEERSLIDHAKLYGYDTVVRFLSEHGDKPEAPAPKVGPV